MCEAGPAALTGGGIPDRPFLPPKRLSEAKTRRKRCTDRPPTENQATGRLEAAPRGPTRKTSGTHSAEESACDPEAGISMPCHYPLRGWRSRSGLVSIAKEIQDSTELLLPCGGCLGCRAANAKAWALRCHLELEQHRSATFTTLTYDDESKPPTLSKKHLADFLKRFRKKMGPARPIRFFASGEYGEDTHREHYHAILYGAHLGDADTIEEAWGHGHCRSEKITPERIAYCAGYTSKKIGYKLDDQECEVVDQTTGEVVRIPWVAPFIQMSRRPGIGGAARAYAASWRLYAVNNGRRMPVPRFLHEAWKAIATSDELEALIGEKSRIRAQRYPEITKDLETLNQLTKEEKTKPKAERKKLRLERTLQRNKERQTKSEYHQQAAIETSKAKQEQARKRRKYG